MIVSGGVVIGGFLEEGPIHFGFGLRRPGVVLAEVGIQWRKRYGFADFAYEMSLVGDGAKLEVAPACWEERGFGQFGLVLKHVFFGKLVLANIVAGDDG
jgi:hypothetical protein